MGLLFRLIQETHDKKIRKSVKNAREKQSEAEAGADLPLNKPNVEGGRFNLDSYLDVLFNNDEAVNIGNHKQKQ